MTDKKNNGQPPCCESGNCCSSAGAGDRRRARWKTIVFMVVILSACAVAAYSLFWRSDNKAKIPCCPAGSAACAKPCGGDSTGAAIDSLTGIHWQYPVADSASGPPVKEQKKASGGNGVD